MYDTIDTVRDLGSQLSAVVSDTFRSGAMRSVSDDDLVAVMDAAAAAIRASEALIAEAAGEVSARSDSPERSVRMTTRFGCRNTQELVQRVTRVSAVTAADWVRAGTAVAPKTSLSSGEALPPAYPAMRSALAAGAVGADAVVAVTRTLDDADVPHAARAAADEELAASARGEGAGGGGLPSADQLKLQAQVWTQYLDPDGTEPRAERAEKCRGVTLGRVRNGLVPLRGQLLPEVAGALQRAFDAIRNPAAQTPVFTEDDAPNWTVPRDGRNFAQRTHDAFATVVNAAARSGDLPTLGGAAPTLLVSVRESDLASGRGAAHVDGIDHPVPLSVARHVACTGSIQRVVFDSIGRIVRIEIPDRVFDHYQRKALTLRDGGCIIPGCTVPAAWTEVHHVTDHAKGGPTSTCNGVLLCWHHHRTLDTSGWRIRMNGGIPEVQGPRWWDRTGAWHPFTTSPTRTLERYALRQ